MSRSKGSENKDSAKRKRQILDRIWQAMRESKGKTLSWREMAVAGGVGPATLSHHFGKRDDVVKAILTAKCEEGAGPLEILAQPTSENLERSLTDALDHMILGLTQFDVGDLVSLGMAEGIYHQTIGPQFVRDGLEPIIEGLQHRLQRHKDNGDFENEIDLREVAILLASPILLTYTHQSPLNGMTVVRSDLSSLARIAAKSVCNFLRS